QAEDGIRDFHVTGVQTCALPIFIQERASNACRVQFVVDCDDLRIRDGRRGTAPRGRGRLGGRFDRKGAWRLGRADGGHRFSVQEVLIEGFGPCFWIKGSWSQNRSRTQFLKHAIDSGTGRTGFQKMEGFVESELGTDLDFDESPDHLLNRILVLLRGDYRDENDWRVRVTPRRKRFKTGRSQCSRKSIVDLQIPRFRGW